MPNPVVDRSPRLLGLCGWRRVMLRQQCCHVDQRNQRRQYAQLVHEPVCHSWKKSISSIQVPNWTSTDVGIKSRRLEKEDLRSVYDEVRVGRRMSVRRKSPYRRQRHWIRIVIDANPTCLRSVAGDDRCHSSKRPAPRHFSRFGNVE